MISRKTIVLCASVFLVAAGCNKTSVTTTPTTPVDTATPAATSSSAPTNETALPTSNPAATQQATPPSGVKTFTMAEVQAANSKQKCWAVISGSVYDLTSWMEKHPGGERAILSLCGTDGTAAFTGQHGDSKGPNTRLAGFKIGVLK